MPTSYLPVQNPHTFALSTARGYPYRVRVPVLAAGAYAITVLGIYGASVYHWVAPVHLAPASRGTRSVGVYRYHKPTYGTYGTVGTYRRYYTAYIKSQNSIVTVVIRKNIT